jgi:hypothetical protein
VQAWWSPPKKMLSFCRNTWQNTGKIICASVQCSIYSYSADWLFQQVRGSILCSTNLVIIPLALWHMIVLWCHLGSVTESEIWLYKAVVILFILGFLKSVCAGSDLLHKL